MITYSTTYKGETNIGNEVATSRYSVFIDFFSLTPLPFKYNVSKNTKLLPFNGCSFQINLDKFLASARMIY